MAVRNIRRRGGGGGGSLSDSVEISGGVGTVKRTGSGGANRRAATIPGAPCCEIGRRRLEKWKPLGRKDGWSRRWKYLKKGVESWRGGDEKGFGGGGQCGGAHTKRRDSRSDLSRASSGSPILLRIADARGNLKGHEDPACSSEHPWLF